MGCFGICGKIARDEQNSVCTGEEHERGAGAVY